MCSVLDLPDDIIQHRVFKEYFHNSRDNLCNFSLVCKRWLLLARADDVWRVQALTAAVAFNPISDYFYDYYYNADAALEAQADRADAKGQLALAAQLRAARLRPDTVMRQ